MKKTYYINNPSGNLPDNQTTKILRCSDAIEFHSSLPGYKPTPVRSLDNLAKDLGIGKILVKDESHRFGLNAFKGLGASFAIKSILDKDPEVAVFCTATDGNHGRSVAWSASLFEKEARIFVPKDTVLQRIKAIEAEGAVVVRTDVNYDKTCAIAAAESRKNGWQLVQDTAWEGYEEIPAQIKAGYLTQLQEMESTIHSLPNAGVDVVFLQAGVGSWPAAAAWYYANRYGIDSPKIVLVEPLESCGLLQSLSKGKRTEPEGNFRTMMAGLNCGIPSLTAWEILKESVDVSIAVEDKWAEQAIKRLYYPTGDDAQVISGESGAGGMAGLLALLSAPEYSGAKEALEIDGSSRVLIISTEGATDRENFDRIVQEPGAPQLH